MAPLLWMGWTPRGQIGKKVFLVCVSPQPARNIIVVVIIIHRTTTILAVLASARAETPSGPFVRIPRCALLVFVWGDTLFRNK